jgi:hypothetical protein
VSIPATPSPLASYFANAGQVTLEAAARLRSMAFFHRGGAPRTQRDAEIHTLRKPQRPLPLRGETTWPKVVAATKIHKNW